MTELEHERQFNNIYYLFLKLFFFNLTLIISKISKNIKLSDIHISKFVYHNKFRLLFKHNIFDKTTYSSFLSVFIKE